MRAFVPLLTVLGWIAFANVQIAGRLASETRRVDRSRRPW